MELLKSKLSVPELPANIIDQPSQVQLEQQMDELDGKINALKEHIENTRGEIRNNKLSSINEAKNPEIKAQVAEIRNTIKGIRELRQVKVNEYNELRRVFYDLLEAQKQMRKKIQIRDYKEACNRIEEIKYNLETGSMNLQDEKKLVTELKNLEISKPYILESNEKQKLIDANKDRQKAKNAEIDVFNKQIKAENSKIDVIIKEAKDRRAQFEADIPNLKEEGKTAGGEVDKLYQQKRDLRAKFGEDKKLYWAQQKIIKQREFILMIHARLNEQAQKQKEWEARQAEKEKKREQMKKQKEKQKKEYEERKARREEIEAEKKARAEEEKLHPWANEINICQRLISYCEYTTSQQEATTAEQITPEV